MQVSNSHFPRPFPAGASTQRVRIPAKPDKKFICMQHNINQHFVRRRRLHCCVVPTNHGWKKLVSTFLSVCCVPRPSAFLRPVLQSPDADLRCTIQTGFKLRRYVHCDTLLLARPLVRYLRQPHRVRNRNDRHIHTR